MVKQFLIDENQLEQLKEFLNDEFNSNAWVGLSFDKGKAGSCDFEIWRYGSKKFGIFLQPLPLNKDKS